MVLAIPNAEAKLGVSVNDITDHKHIDELTGNAAFSGLPVSIEKIGLLAPKIPDSGKPMFVLYGSCTGNAEFTAQELFKEAKSHKLVAQVRAMDDIDISDIVNAERILVLCSTYGEGEMPGFRYLLLAIPTMRRSVRPVNNGIIVCLNWALYVWPTEWIVTSTMWIPAEGWMADVLPVA